MNEICGHCSGFGFLLPPSERVRCPHCDGKRYINHNSQEEIDKRKNQNDPLIMYLIVREEINMSIGKTAAQCAHASQILLLKHYEYRDYITDLVTDDTMIEPKILLDISNRMELFYKWLNSSFRKVVLTANEKEWSLLKEKLNKENYIIVTDAGLTELEPNTQTVLGLFPLYKSEAPKVIKYLRTLK